MSTIYTEDELINNDWFIFYTIDELIKEKLKMKKQTFKMGFHSDYLQ